METAMINAIDLYSELSGLDRTEIARECLKEGPIREAVTLLLFTQAD